jgi:hypothetical protein
MDTSLLILSIAAAVYAAALALMSLPFREFKAWGHAAFMHSITSIGLLAIIPTLVAVRSLIAPYVQPYIGVDISAGPETALAHVTQYRSMVFEWINAVNLSAEALGAIQGVMMMALTPLLLSGVGVLFASIASYLFSAVFGLLIFAQRFLSLLYLFSEVVRVFMALAPILGPGMFTAGLILYAVPFGRRLGKTLIVFGAALTLVLPPAIVAALPSPAEAEAEIQKTREIQAYSIALDNIRRINAATKINVYDRNGTIIHVDRPGGASWEVVEENGTIRLKSNRGGFHESRMVNYPYFKLKLKEPEKAPPLFINCSALPPSVSCEQVAQAALEMLKQPESGFINSGQEKIEDGYRMMLTMPELAGPGKRAGVYEPDIWLLGLRMHVQGDSGRRGDTVKIIGYEVEYPGSSQQGSGGSEKWWENGDVYKEWKHKWEDFWDDVPLKKLYLENAVQEGGNTSLIWFTQTPVGSDAPLNVFVVDAPAKEVVCRVIGTETIQVGNETITRHKYGVFYGVKSDTPVTYFAYLDGAKYEVRSDWPDIRVRELNGSELSRLKGVVKAVESLRLKPTIPAAENSTPPDLEAAPPAHYMEVYVPAGEYLGGEGYTCEEAYANFLKSQVKSLMIEDLVYGNNTPGYPSDRSIRECYRELLGQYEGYINSTNNEAGNYTGPELIMEPDKLNSTQTLINDRISCSPLGDVKLTVTVEFILLEESPYAPYKPDVKWDKFDMDERYAEELASGKYVSENSLPGVNVETHREEWARYPTFRLGLYRDSPIHYGQRILVQKLLEYRDESSRPSPIAALVYNTFRKAVEEARSRIPGGGVVIPAATILVTDKGGVTILDALASLLGNTAALAFALIVFAIAADAVSGMIGGESAVKATMASPMSSLLTAFYKGGSIASAIRGGSRVNIAGYVAARRQEGQMLRAADEERKRNPARFKEMARARIRALKNDTVSERVKAVISERLLSLKDRIDSRRGALRIVGKPVSLALGQLSKGYLLDTHRYMLRSDPAYAMRHLDQARLVSQMRPAAMRPGEWARGMGHMIKAAPSRLEKLALIERVIRDPRIGRNLIIAWGKGVDGRVRAPAAFAIAAQASKPPVDGLGGRRPEIPHATPMSFGVGLVTWGADRVETPYIHGHKDPYMTFADIHRSIEHYESYSRPLTNDEKAELAMTLLNIHVKQDLGGELSSPPIKVAEVDPSWIDVRLERFWIETDNVGGLPPTIHDNIVKVEEARERLGPEESYEIAFLKGYDYGPQLPRDIREAFPWASGDAIDRLAADGHNIGQVLSHWWEAGATSPHVSNSPAAEPSPSMEAASRWWEAGEGAKIFVNLFRVERLRVAKGQEHQNTHQAREAAARQPA